VAHRVGAVAPARVVEPREGIDPKPPIKCRRHQRIWDEVRRQNDEPAPVPRNHQLEHELVPGQDDEELGRMGLDWPAVSCDMEPMGSDGCRALHTISRDGAPQNSGSAAYVVMRASTQAVSVALTAGQIGRAIHHKP
jgi:hypothetical protein